ncbi:MAG: hypothetical protein AAF677_05030 [Pseudomonadota bacterium]
MTSALAMGLALGALAAAPAAALPIVLDFDTAYFDDGTSRPTVDGESVTLPGASVRAPGEDRGLFAGIGVRIGIDRGDSQEQPLVLYNSDCNGGLSGTGLPNCSGGDNDLATGIPTFGTPSQGRVLIIQTNGSETNLQIPGAPAGTTTRGYKKPNDDLNGGAVTFYFDAAVYEHGVRLIEIDIVDLDEDIVGSGVTFTATKIEDDELGAASAQTYDLPSDQVLRMPPPGVVPAGCQANNDGSVFPGVCENDNSLRDFFFAGFDTRNLRSITVEFNSISGAIGAFVFAEETGVVPVPAGLPLALTAFATLGYMARRRRREQAAWVD